MMLASLAKGGEVPDAPEGVVARARLDSDDSEDEYGTTAKGGKRISRRGKKAPVVKPKAKKAPATDVSKQNLLAALVRNEAHAQKRRGRDELTEMATRIATADDDDELPGPSQASVTTNGGEAQLDALGLATLSPSRKGKLNRAEIKQGLRLAQNAHYLGDGVKDDEFERLDAMLVEGATTEDEDGVAEDAAEAEAAAEAARIRELRSFWATVPTFDPPTLWEAGTERNVAKLVHKALASASSMMRDSLIVSVGIATPSGFRCDVLQPSMQLDFIDALVCLAWVVLARC